MIDYQSLLPLVTYGRNDFFIIIDQSETSIFRNLFFLSFSSYRQVDTDAPAQGHPQPHAVFCQKKKKKKKKKMELKKGS